MSKDRIEDDLIAAEAAAKHAASVRKIHRRRTEKGSSQREEDLRFAADRVRTAMKPIRSFIGAAPYATPSQRNLAMIDRVKEASSVLQAERRKLWKMQKRDATPQTEETHDS